MDIICAILLGAVVGLIIVFFTIMWEKELESIYIIISTYIIVCINICGASLSWIASYGRNSYVITYKIKGKTKEIHIG